MRRVERAVNSFPEKFGEAWLSCMLVMTQGDISVWTFQHVKVAYNTGISTAITYALCVLFLRKISKPKSIALTGVLTFIADLFNHPAHFEAWYSEALLTGLGSSLFALIFCIFAAKIKLR